MKKCFAMSLALLVVLAGGCKKKHKAASKAKDTHTEIDIPTAHDGIKSFFDEDVQEFKLDEEGKKVADLNANIDAQNDEFAFLDNENKGPFKKIYFDFDKYAVRNDQEDSLAHDIQAAKQEIELCQATGKPLPTLVIDGHACHSAGSRAYNLALSEKRAKVLADRMIEAGIPQECLKIVGRGSEMPALVKGKPVEGDREAQWPNRRDELHVIAS